MSHDDRRQQSTAMIVLVGFALSRGLEAKNTDPRSLVGVSEKEVGIYAIEWTQKHYRVVSGIPKALLARSVTSRDLPALGLGTINTMAEEPPFMLVILQGDFDMSNMWAYRNNPPGGSRVSYVAYLFDLWAGVPSNTIASPTVDTFRLALSNPPLPSSEVQDGLPLRPDTSAILEPTKLPYGSIAPGIDVSEDSSDPDPYPAPGEPP
jgi:hypothetical protein